MANTIQPDELGQDQNNNQAGQQNVGSSANQAGQPPVQSQGNAPSITSSQVNNPNQQKGSGYTNIQKVLQANQGNQLGSAIGNNIQQVGSSAQDNLKNAQNQFQQGTQANQFNTQQNQQLAQDVLADPTKYNTQDQTNPNAQNGSQFQTLLSGQYQGPQGLANSSELQNQAQNVAQMGQALGTSGGRIGLLQQMVGNPQYTAGQSNLDNLLLGQSTDPALQAAKRQALTLQGKVGSAIQGANAQGQQASNQAQQFGQALQGQFGNTVNQENSSLQNQAIQAQQGRDADYKQALANLQSGQVTQDQAKLLGLSQGENLYGVDATKFLQENPLQANVSNVASAQDYAKMQALQKLGGQFAPQNTQQAFQNFQNPSQAGQFQASQALTGDQSGLQNAVNSTQQNFLQQLAAISPGGAIDPGSIGGSNSLLSRALGGNNLAGGVGAGLLTRSTGAGLLASLGGALFGGGDQAAQARETAKQAESGQLGGYIDKLKGLASQYGMNIGKFGNMSDAYRTALLDPQNVGANYQDILNQVNQSLAANNAVNITPNAAPVSAYPTVASSQQNNLEQFPTVS